MKITKNTKQIPNGTVVCLPGGEMLRVVEYIERYGGSGYDVYKVQFVENDGDEYIDVGDVRIFPASELIGGEIE